MYVRCRTIVSGSVWTVAQNGSVVQLMFASHIAHVCGARTPENATTCAEAQQSGTTHDSAGLCLAAAVSMQREGMSSRALPNRATGSSRPE